METSLLFHSLPFIRSLALKVFPQTLPQSIQYICFPLAITILSLFPIMLPDHLQTTTSYATFLSLSLPFSVSLCLLLSLLHSPSRSSSFSLDLSFSCSPSLSPSLSFALTLLLYAFSHAFSPSLFLFRSLSFSLAFSLCLVLLLSHNRQLLIIYLFFVRLIYEFGYGVNSDLCDGRNEMCWISNIEKRVEKCCLGLGYESTY
ncbi:unnamed protein product [Acanthosepion pharaonis]|uniref:Uncharacterized protein n=1 Tax=Acanthosepion pharaonis TaxID=158019 RepID=A0A812CQH8_ACAPH|nr:unnamed protein product [Sepia pharaonis]